jgi:DNA polymerase sigma
MSNNHSATNNNNNSSGPHSLSPSATFSQSWLVLGGHTFPGDAALPTQEETNQSHAAAATAAAIVYASWIYHNGLLYFWGAGSESTSMPPIENAPVLASTERIVHLLTNYPGPTTEAANIAAAPATQNSSTMTSSEQDSELEDIEPLSQTTVDSLISSGRVWKRVDNIADWIRNALDDIRQMRHRSYSSKGPKKKHRISPDERRENALEHQRRRLQAQLSSSLSQTNKNDNDIRETDDMGLDGEEENDDIGNNYDLEKDNDEDKDENEDPWWRFARTFNSCKILTSLLLPVFRHKQRHKPKLDLGNGVTVTRKDKQCWLIIQTDPMDSLLQPHNQQQSGHGYYSVTTKTSLASLNRLLMDVLTLIVSNPFLDSMDGENNAAVHRQKYLDSWDDEAILQALDDSMHRLCRILETTTIQKSLALPFHLTTNFDLERVFQKMTENVVARSKKGNTKQKKQILDCKSINRLQKHLHLIDHHCDLTVNSSTASSSTRRDSIDSRYLDSIHALRQCLSQILTRRFPNSRLSVYGSCLSDLSTGTSADVDLSLHVEALESAKTSFDAGKMSVLQYQKILKTHVYQTCRALESRRGEFVNMVPVTRARVPVVKGTWIKANNPHSADGSIDFDVCFLNDIAVMNSELLRQYSLVDARVKKLMVTVKSFVKHMGIGTAQDNHLSSYAWTNLVIFYCQCIDLVPNLQCPKLMEKAGVKRDPNNHWHSIRNLDTCYLTWKQASTVWVPPQPGNNHWSVSALLYGFLEFYAHAFPTKVFLISIKRGKDGILPKTVFRKSCLFWMIEDPFETFDSHCPHDLGMHANEPGALRILRCFQTAAVDTRQKLVDSLLQNNGLNGHEIFAEMSQCWPFLVNDSKKATTKKASSAKPQKSQNRNSKSNDSKPKNRDGNKTTSNAAFQKHASKQQEKQHDHGPRKHVEKHAAVKNNAKDEVPFPSGDSSTPTNRSAHENGRRRQGKLKQGASDKQHIIGDLPKPSNSNAHAPNKQHTAKEALSKNPTHPTTSVLNPVSTKPKSTRRRRKGDQRHHDATRKSSAKAGD